MRVIPVSQGTQEWLELRAKHNTASEAPAVMGASKYMSRSDLMKQKATGITPDVDSAKQALFNRGHAAEEGARAILERVIDEDLYPVTCVCEKTNLLASLDGLNMSGTIAFECKLWNERLVEQVRAGNLEPHYYWQLEQELLVTGAEKVIFVTSDGTEDKFVSMDYRAVPGRAEQLIAAWAQFDKDLAAYTPVEAAPVAIGRAPETLPALHIEVTGMVTASNLDAFKSNAMAVFGQINRELKTDADFANAEKTVKWCGDVEDRLAAAKQHALSQTASIDVLFKAIDDISAEARAVRLELDKLVKARKEAIRGELVAEGVKALADHVNALNDEIAPIFLRFAKPDFGAVIKGKRTIESLRDAVNTELANTKISLSQLATETRARLLWYRDAAKGFEFLFPDLQEIIFLK
ncbi:MAG TPA: YqaJ viral recombinase family protein [Acidovorax defluvii]|nr:YqaJ viral recombinase family protein [Acidovorax defluvii]HQS65524.1 YqaJ viral recombinase family protein [Acidovorax defluvii]